MLALMAALDATARMSSKAQKRVPINTRWCAGVDFPSSTTRSAAWRAEECLVTGEEFGSASANDGVARNSRLDSWKEIAAYLRRDVTTVRRWEKREGLPVHRHLHERRESVYAFTVEIDAWSDSRRTNLLKSEATEAPPRARAAWVLAVIFCVTSVALGGMLVTRGGVVEVAEPPIERRFLIPPPEGVTFNHVSLSPDGRYVAFTAAGHGEPPQKTKLWIRALDSLEARALPDTDGASFPFWSPGSDGLGFFAAGKLWTIEPATGNARSVAVAPDGRGGTWNRAGIIVFGPSPNDALAAVPAAGGATTAVTKRAATEITHVWPEFLPDGNHFLYFAGVRNVRGEGHRVFIGALDGSPRRELVPASSNVSYANGHLLYIRERQLFARPFDPRTLAMSGDPIAVVDEVFQHYPAPRAEFSVSSNGVLAYRRRQSPATRLVWRDRTGRSTPFLDPPAEYQSPALSPDEDRVVYTVFDPKPSHRFGFGPAGVRGNVALFDRTTTVASEPIADPASEWGGVWSPDGRSIVFSSQRNDDKLGLFWKNMTDLNAIEMSLPSIGNNPVANSWSPDGRFVLFSSVDVKTRGDLWLLPMSGGRTPIPLLTSEFSEDQGRISPDGRWFAYSSNESGHWEVWVATFPKPTKRWRISTEGAGDPRWRRDGRELYYVGEDRLLMAVPVYDSVTFSHGTPVPLFDTGMNPYWYEASSLYDVARDGRFLFMSPIEDDRTAPLTMILNWTARLKH
jgi:dipeptidyl aminopeptidase/acylaminoacyl peptidase